MMSKVNAPLIHSVIFLLCICSSAYAQTGSIVGRIFSSINNDPIPFANIIVQASTYRTVSDTLGKFKIENIVPGIYNVEASYVGFEKKIFFEVEVSSARSTTLDIPMDEISSTIDEVYIVAKPSDKTEESPVSLRTIGSAEIERNPGGNRDISKVIQSLPGVSSTASFRNDIIIRGGAPNENRFYLDGVEVPNINHFATQGSSGGPVGMINVNFVREVKFYSGAFPSNRGNSLSSVFEFEQKEGNSTKMVLNATIGASDLGLTFDGPIGKKANYIFSVRRSYLQFLFQALQLPFLPTYNDAQYKVKVRLTEKDELTLIGLGAIDQFALNLKANTTDFQKYVLGYLPVNTQWNYVTGAVYKHFREKSYTTIVVSRNQLNNNAKKYFNNDRSVDSNLILDYNSQEIENKLRIENTFREKNFKLNFGGLAEQVTYTNSTYSKKASPSGIYILDFKSRFDFGKYGLFIQASDKFVNEKLVLSFGVRSDAVDYSVSMRNPLNQISPRFSLSYQLPASVSINFNTGRYFQLPAYTVMGYRNAAGDLENKYNNVSFIQCDHLVAGMEWSGKNNFRISVEGFYKKYSHYPFLTRDSVSLANLGADFGVIGNGSVVSTGNGASYGLEILAQQRLFKGFYGILAYTYVYSKFSDKYGELIPSAWDNRNIVTITAGKKFKRNWELGLKWRFLGGAPYTPYDIAASSLRAIWDVTGTGILNYDQLNTKRLPAVHQLDLRVDKKYFFKKWSLDVYLDVQNAYNYQAELAPYIDVVRDSNGNATTDPNFPNSYLLKEVKNLSGTLLPTIGIIVDL